MENLLCPWPGWPDDYLSFTLKICILLLACISLGLAPSSKEILLPLFARMKDLGNQNVPNM